MHVCRIQMAEWWNRFCPLIIIIIFITFRFMREFGSFLAFIFIIRVVTDIIGIGGNGWWRRNARLRELIVSKINYVEQKKFTTLQAGYYVLRILQVYAWPFSISWILEAACRYLSSKLFPRARWNIILHSSRGWPMDGICEYGRPYYISTRHPILWDTRGTA